MAYIRPLKGIIRPLKSLKVLTFFVLFFFFSAIKYVKAEVNCVPLGALKGPYPRCSRVSDTPEL